MALIMTPIEIIWKDREAFALTLRCSPTYGGHF